MEIVIFCLFILFVLYLFWLLAVVYKWDFRAFLFIKDVKPEFSQEAKEEKKEVNILGQTEIKFLDKLPEPEPIKPKWEEPLEREADNDQITEPEVKDSALSLEEQEEIRRLNEQESFWEDNDPNEGFSVEDVRHAADTFAGTRKSEADIERAKNTLKHVPDEFIELFAQHAINDKKIKDMLSEHLDRIENSVPPKTKLKDFVVEDHVA